MKPVNISNNALTAIDTMSIRPMIWGGESMFMNSRFIFYTSFESKCSDALDERSGEESIVA